MRKNIDNIKRSEKVNRLLERQISPYLRYGAIVLILFFILLYLLFLKLPIIEGQSLSEYLSF